MGRGKNGIKTELVVMSVFAAVLACGFCIALIILWRRCRQQKGTASPNHKLTADFEGAGPKTFTFSELAAATNNFADDRKLGKGGFGCVYKGLLINSDIPVAVKRISRHSRQGMKEYHNILANTRSPCVIIP